MATPNETPAAPAAPASVAPVAKPLSAAELQREISSPPPVERAPSPAAEAPKEKLRAPELPSIKEDKASPPRPDFKSALKDKVMKKEEAAPVVEAPKVEKKPAISADDAPPPKAETVTDAVVPDEHKRVLPHDKPDTAKRIKAILAERDAAKQEAAAAKAEYEAAKKAPSTPPE
jgi:translation initiation factor IF-2